MFMMRRNHFEIVKDSLNGRMETNEHTFASIEVLKERMERLKQLDKNFADIEFSPFVWSLKRQRKEVAVG
jgi:hypothetical protein